MKARGWQETIISVVRQFETGNDKPLQLLAATLEEMDAAKQELYDRGHGVTGQPLLEVVKAIAGKWGRSSWG